MPVGRHAIVDAKGKVFFLYAFAHHLLDVIVAEPARAVWMILPVGLNDADAQDR